MRREPYESRNILALENQIFISVLCFEKLADNEKETEPYVWATVLLRFGRVR